MKNRTDFWQVVKAYDWARLGLLAIHLLKSKKMKLLTVCLK